jgi:lipopolysaccharide biosynthesis glycosyltransferase
MDLEGIRRDGVSAKLFENTRKFADILCWYDQDMINLVCQGRILQLDKLWNCADRYSPFRCDVRQWHFQGFTQHPWCNLWKNITWIPYLKYLLKSPYRDNWRAFVWAHIKGFFFFTYEKKGVERTLVCGILVRKKRVQS